MDENQFDDDTNHEAKEGSSLNDTTFEHKDPTFDTSDENLSSDEFNPTEIAPSEVEPTSGEEATDTSDPVADEGASEDVPASHQDWVAPDPLDHFASEPESDEAANQAEDDAAGEDSHESTTNDAESASDSDVSEQENHTPETNETTPADDSLSADDTSLDAATATTAVAASGSKRWFKKPLVWAAIVVAILVVLLGGSALAYKMWYQTPEKVLSDATLHFVSAKSMTYTGTIAVVDGSTNAQIGLNGGVNSDLAALKLDATITNGDSSYHVPTNLVMSKEAFYVKVSNLADLEKQVLAPYVSAGYVSPDAKAQLDKLVNDIDGTWYKVTPDDLNQTSKDKKIQQCVSKVVDKIRFDKDTQSEITKVYQKHPLFTVSKELGMKDGSLGYELKPVSDKQAGGFIDGFKQTSAYKDLVSCDKSIEKSFDTSKLTDDSSEDTMTLRIWVSQWSHQITKLTMQSKSGDTTVDMTLTPQVGAAYDMSVPNNAKSVDDLKSQIESFSESMTAPTDSSVEATVVGPGKA